MKYAGIVFDKDGTLLDFNKTWLPTYLIAAREVAGEDAALAQQLLEAHGYDARQQRFRSGSLLAAGNNNEIAFAWAEQTGQQQRTELFSQRLYQIFNLEAGRQATAVSGLKGTLAALKQSGVKLGVATADSHQGILNTLQSFDVLDAFDFLAGYDSGHGAKPGSGMVDAFCRQMQLPAQAVMVVGDNRHDIEMGRNAGAGLCVGVLTGTSTRADLEDLADIVLEDIRGIPALI